MREHKSPCWLLSRETGPLTLRSQRCCGFCLQGVFAAASLTLRSILAKPRALDARSLASWNSSFSERLVSMTDRLTGAEVEH